MIHIEINSVEWTIAVFRADWAADEHLSAAEAAEAADCQYAWLINETGTQMRGWTYTGKGFAGTARFDAVQRILELLQASTDYVLSVMDEIKESAAAESSGADKPAEPAACVYHRDSPAACDLRAGGADVALYRVSGNVWCSGALAAFQAEMGASDPAVRGARRI